MDMLKKFSMLSVILQQNLSLGILENNPVGHQVTKFLAEMNRSGHLEKMPGSGSQYDSGLENL